MLEGRPAYLPSVVLPSSHLKGRCLASLGFCHPEVTCRSSANSAWRRHACRAGTKLLNPGVKTLKPRVQGYGQRQLQQTCVELQIQNSSLDSETRAAGQPTSSHGRFQATARVFPASGLCLSAVSRLSAHDLHPSAPITEGSSALQGLCLHRAEDPAG